MVQFDSDGDVVMQDAETEEHDERSAAAKVFDIPELLEKILLSVPGKDVMLLQRVAPNWQGTVRGSQALQRMLFLAPSRERQLIVPADSSLSEREGVYRLFSMRPTQFRVQNTKFSFGEAKDPMDLKVFALNPILSRPVWEVHGCRLRLFANFLEGCWHDGRMAELSTERGSSYSCNDMFLTEPPVKSVICTLRIPPAVDAPIGPCAVCGDALIEPLLSPCCKRFYCREHRKDLKLYCCSCAARVERHGFFERCFTEWSSYEIEVERAGRSDGVRVRDILYALRLWYKQHDEGRAPNGIYFSFPGSGIYQGLVAPIMLSQSDYAMAKDRALEEQE